MLSRSTLKYISNFWLLRAGTEFLNGFVATTASYRLNIDIEEQEKAVKTAEIIILAVKPYNFADIINEIKDTLDPKKHVVVSVITGVWIEQLQKAIGKPVPVIRAMPNTAIAIQQSMTCLAHAGASTAQVDYITRLFDQLGKTVMIKEELMDAATVLGACGTAYAMRYIRANIQGGIEIGFDAATATLIAAQTVKGRRSYYWRKELTRNMRSIK